ncbi:MAG: hypothetical protein ACI396_09045, partial [Acutalibacteraceae bacterium]
HKMKPKDKTALSAHILSTAADVISDKQRRIVLTATAVLAVNICYAVYNGVLGIIYSSLWLAVLCAYYLILSVMRFSAVFCALKSKSGEQIYILRFCGAMLMILSLVLAYSVYYSIYRETAKGYDKITMITIAAYTFYKVILAFINAAKAAKRRSPLLSVIRNIACADAAASLLSLQRSMLVSFDGMSEAEIRLMNTLTGTGVCIFIFILGLIMTLGIFGGKQNGKIKNRKSERENRRKSDKRIQEDERCGR